MNRDTISRIASPDSDAESVDMFSTKNNHSVKQRSFQPVRAMSPPVSPIPIFSRIGNLPRRAPADSTDAAEIMTTRRGGIAPPSEIGSTIRRNNMIKMTPPENPFSDSSSVNRERRVVPPIPPTRHEYDSAPQFFMSQPPPHHLGGVPSAAAYTPHQDYPPYNMQQNPPGSGGGGASQAVHHFHHSAPQQQQHMQQGNHLHMQQVHHPQYQQYQPPPCCEHSSAAAGKLSTRPNYAALNEEESHEMKMQFIKKILILRTVVPNWGIVVPAESASLNYFHDIYELYSKQITVYINTFYFKVGLCFVFIFLQWGMGYTGVSMDGYAMSQINTINNYDCLLMELSEKYMASGGGEPMSIEKRFIYFAALQAMAFMFCGYVEKMTGSKQLAEYMRKFVATNVIDKLKEKGDDFDPTAGLDNVGVPLVPGLEDQIRNASYPSGAAAPTSTAPAAPAAAAGGGGIMDILGAVGGLMGNNADVNGNLAGAFGGIMNALGNMNNNGRPADASTATTPRRPPTSPGGPPRSRPSRPTTPMSPAMSPPRSARKRPVFNQDPNSEDVAGPTEE